MITQILPSYLYQQYQKVTSTDDLEAFFTAYNNTAQTYLDNTNSLNLPVYTEQIAPLLDWTALGIYGILRPSLPVTSEFTKEGAYDTFEYDTLPYNQNVSNEPSSFYTITDDFFKRIITWNFYRGDGYQYTTMWLKRRVARFLYGIDGTDIPDIADLYNVSVTYSAPNSITITVPDLGDISAILSTGIQYGVLSVPYEYDYSVSY
jgi:hypothetical protein